MFCGDVHLGRRPSGLPRDLDQQSGLTSRDLDPKAALARCVEEAQRRSIDAFVFAGDVVDEENSRFEAYGILRACVENLLASGIRTFAVSGNHDVDTLPRLARDLPNFQLIGAGGEWEDVLVHGREGPIIALRGWSFPTRRVTASPLSRPRKTPPIQARAVLGVVHGDLDVSGSHYAPLATRDLEAERAVAAWFLGHIHKPSLDPRATRPIGYLGSLSALDRTEIDDHGPWLATIAESGSLEIQQIPLAPLRFEECTLDATNWESPDQCESELTRALSAAVERARERSNPPLALGLSVKLIGSVTMPAGLRQVLRRYHDSGLPQRNFERLHSFIAKLEDNTRPRTDLERRKASDDPVGLLARRILELDDPNSGVAARLVEQARRRFDAQLRKRNEFAELGAVSEESDAQIRERLKRAGWRALEALEATRADGPR